MKLFRKFTLFTIIFAFLLLPSAVSANTAPDFPVCSNPQGDLKVNYESGIHGVIGNEGEYSGKDSVYSVEQGYLQCLCTDQGGGIQTNWWRVNDLTREQIEQLKNEDWIYVADGFTWGLDGGAYLAKNSTYSCGDTQTPTPTPTPTTPGHGGGETPHCTAERPDAPYIVSIDRNGTKATITWTKVDKATHYTISYGPSNDDYPYGVFNTGNVTSYEIEGLDPNIQYHFKVYAVNDCMPSEASSERPIGGTVLGLAATGGALLILELATSGLALVSAGILLKRKSHN